MSADYTKSMLRIQPRQVNASQVGHVFPHPAEPEERVDCGYLAGGSALNASHQAVPPPILVRR